MGSKSRALLLSLHEAAELVGHHPRWTSRVLKAAGILPANRTKSHTKTGNQLLFDRAEVEAFVRSRGGGASIEKTTTLAYKTDARVASLEQRVDMLEYMLGLRVEKLAMDEESMLSRYTKAMNFSEAKQPSISLSAVLEWSRFLLAVTEEYFHMMERTLKVQDPWDKFLGMGERIAIALADQDSSIPSVCAAQEYLDVGRKNLRAVAYSCAARTYGLGGATERVPLSQEGDVDEEVIAIILSREVTRPYIKAKRS